MNSTINEKKLTGKDLLTTGIFSAIILVITIAIACIIGMIPVGFLALCFVTPFVGGIPTMLFYTKIKKFGMLLIMTTVSGLILILTGVGWYGLVFGLISNLIAELILKKSNYSSGKSAVIAYMIASLSACANYIQWIFASEKFLADNSVTYGQNMVDVVCGFFGYSWSIPVIIIGALLGGLLGGLLGRAVLKKHFVKSGLV